MSKLRKPVYEKLDPNATGKFERHDLDFDRTIDYFIGHISCRRTLSKSIINKIDFKKGKFFTLLFEEARKEWLYDFNGGIFSSQAVEDPVEVQKMQQSAEQSPVLSQLKVSSFRIVKTMTRVCIEFIYNFLKANSDHVAVMDQYIIELANLSIEGVDVAFYQDEVHYLVHSNAPFDSIGTALKKADIMWHLLVILMEGLEAPKKDLNEQDFDTICTNAKYIITRAYDGEGYIFWERV